MIPALLLLAAPALAGASLYDPHVPKGTPWFEGWYTRISDTTAGVSIGAIVGYYPDAARLRDPAAYVALIVDRGHGEALTFEAHPAEVSVLAAGAPVVRDPDKRAPANFSLAAGGGLADLQQRGGTQVLKMNFTKEGVFFEATLTSPEPWDASGDGPEGWAGRLPLVGLHWFVYSLRSSASFRLTAPGVGTIAGTGGAHQEKNWGAAFPRSWVWAEALGAGGARLALAGGPTSLGPITVPNLFLVGYRSARLDWSFHPQDPSRFSQAMDACAGTLELTAVGPGRMLKVTLKVDPSSGGGLFTVGGPTRSGFRADSVESYRANVTVEAYSGLFHERLEERVELAAGALEFGGDARCRGGIAADAPARTSFPVLGSRLGTHGGDRRPSIRNFTKRAFDSDIFV